MKSYERKAPRFQNEVAQIRCLFLFFGGGGRLATLLTICPPLKNPWRRPCLHCLNSQNPLPFPSPTQGLQSTPHGGRRQRSDPSPGYNQITVRQSPREIGQTGRLESYGPAPSDRSQIAKEASAQLPINHRGVCHT